MAASVHVLHATPPEIGGFLRIGSILAIVSSKLFWRLTAFVFDDSFSMQLTFPSNLSLLNRFAAAVARLCLIQIQQRWQVWRRAVKNDECGFQNH
jgi:hypothetical protein